ELGQQIDLIGLGAVTLENINLGSLNLGAIIGSSSTGQLILERDSPVLARDGLVRASFFEQTLDSRGIGLIILGRFSRISPRLVSNIGVEANQGVSGGIGTANQSRHRAVSKAAGR